MKLNKLFILLILSLVFYSCENEPAFDNPLDPENPVFDPPETMIVSGPEEGNIVNTSSVSFSFSGNDLVVEYSYNLNNTGWSEWSSETGITLSYLDEGMHNFQVKGRYLSLDEDLTSAEVNFEVDAIEGPSIRVFPLLSMTEIGQIKTVDIFIEEVEAVMLTEFTISYNPLFVALQNIEMGELLSEFSGETVMINESFEENGINFIRFDIGVALGEVGGINGSGSIVKIEFLPVSIGIFDIEISNQVELRDYNNIQIPINQIVNGKFEIH